MTRRILIALIALYCLCHCAFAQSVPNFSFNQPPKDPAVFADGFISTFMNERDFAISPDGNEFYFTISTPRSTFQTIVFSKRNDKGSWSYPEVVSFAGNYSDLEPAFSSDGKTLFFASNRPLNGDVPKDFDIWKVTRNGDAWGLPENLGPAINTAEDEFYPSITANGNLYFTASYKEGKGKEDIYVSELKNNTYSKPISLDSAVNSAAYEFNAFVAPDESYILFTSFGRKEDIGGGDLFISTKNKEGVWRKAMPLKSLNSKRLDYCPYVSPDGKILFFTSERNALPTTFPEKKATYKAIKDAFFNTLNGTGNIYWVDFHYVLNAIPKP